MTLNILDLCIEMNVVTPRRTPRAHSYFLSIQRRPLCSSEHQVCLPAPALIPEDIQPQSRDHDYDFIWKIRLSKRHYFGFTAFHSLSFPSIAKALDFIATYCYF